MEMDVRCTINSRKLIDSDSVLRESVSGGVVIAT